MKKLFLTTAIVMSSAVTAFAADQAVTINATVDPFCTIANAANTTVTISVGSTTGLTTGVSAAPTLDVTCNKASNVALTSAKGAVTLAGALQSALAAPAVGFRNKIEYSAAIDGGAGAVTLTTSSGAEGVTTSNVFNAAAVITSATAVTITPETSTAPLLAGSYTDTLTVAVTPAP